MKALFCISKDKIENLKTRKSKLATSTSSKKKQLVNWLK